MKRWLCSLGAVAGALILFLTAITAESQARSAKTHPRLIELIRHAEKPPEEAKSVDLSAEGKKRADALLDLFKKSDARPNPLPPPDYIFATKNTKHSHRPLETVTPLAKKLRLAVNTDFADDDHAALAKELFQNAKYSGKTVLICWHHGKMPDLAYDLKADDAPDKWKDDVFDRVWLISYDENGKAAFSKVAERLLPGDTK